MKSGIFIFLFGSAWTISLCFLFITWVGKSNTESCEQLAMHLNAVKYEWISGHGCWIDGRHYK